jgi:PAS domain S-box-containing protein
LNASTEFIPSPELLALADVADGWVGLFDESLRLHWQHASQPGPWSLHPAETGQPVWPALAQWQAQGLDEAELRAALDSQYPTRRHSPSEAAPGILSTTLRAWPGPPRRGLLILRTVPEVAQALGETRQTLNFVLESAGLGLAERNLVTGAGRWTEPVFRMFGFDPAGGAPSVQVANQRLHPDDNRAEDYLTRLKQPGRHEQRFRVCHPDGQERTLQTRWQVLAGPDGQPRRLLALLSDETERVAMERRYGVTAEQLRLAIDVAGVGLWRHEFATESLHYSQRAFELLGFQVRESGSVPLAEVRQRIHPEDLARVQASAQHTLVTGEPTDFEARYQRTDGQWRTVLSRRVIERDANGQAVGFQGVSMDITEQQQERLRSQELARRLDQSVAASGLGIWSFRPAHGDQAGTSQWNPQMYAMYGLDPALPPPMGHAWEALVHPEDRSNLRLWASEAVRAPGRMFSCTYRIRHQQGRWRWLEQRASFSLLGDSGEFSGVTLDITERVHTEAALREASDRAGLALNAARMGTWTLNVLTQEATWDERMFLLRGLVPRDQPPDSQERLSMVHPEDRHLFLHDRFDPSSAPDPRTPTLEFRVVWPDGSVHWLATRSSALPDASGRYFVRTGVNWDVTERKAAQQAHDERAAAVRASQAKTEFLARVSHELRTPLNAVLGFTQLLADELPQQASSQQMKLQHVREAGEHLLSLINDVLDLSRLEAGKLPLDMQPLKVADVLAQALMLLDDLRQRQAITLALDVADHTVQADPIRLRQVLVNLLSNAIKYNRQGGQVRVLCCQDELAGQALLRLDVQDQGHGLGPEQLQHLFEPFNRLGAQGQGVEGTGIGLVICKALVEAMGGHIALTSTRGQGTVASVWLPLPSGRVDVLPAGSVDVRPSGNVDVPAPGKALSPPGTALQGDAVAGDAVAGDAVAGEAAERLSGRVLYIEDNPVNVMLVQELLHLRSAVELEVAETGHQGIDRALDVSLPVPDLVLVDMQLPDMDGHEVLRQLRAHAQGAGLPCVALSANAMRSDIDTALAAGFADYWTKPIDFAHFLSALGKQLLGSRAAASIEHRSGR